MAQIPARENLESMSRIDIQKMCKDNNIRANMRTDEMINALCDLVNGKEVPRPHRAMSERITSQPLPKGRLSSVQPPAPHTSEISAKKPALHPSEPHTDAESVIETPTSAPVTRRKAKDIQLHLGKGRPVVAGGSGARTVTKVVSRGTGRKTKASAMLQEDAIPEEDEDTGSIDVLAPQKTECTNANKVARPSSTRSISPIAGPPGGSQDEQPSQLPTPTPSHPSYSFPSAQLAALESRITQLEEPRLASRISKVEAEVADISVLKAQIPALQDQIRHLEAGHRKSEADVNQWAKSRGQLKDRVTCLEIQVNGLVVEIGNLKDRVLELETKLQDLEGTPDASMNGFYGLAKDAKASAALDTGAGITPRPIIPSELPDPSPSQPTLGKRTRNLIETPDISVNDIVEGTQQQYEGDKRAAIDRVNRPQRKRPRLDLDTDENPRAFSSFKHDRAGPSSTSTPQQRRSNSPPGFFTAGRRAPTPLVRTDDGDAYLCLAADDPVVQLADALKGDDVTEKTNSQTAAPYGAAPHTPPPRIAGAGHSSNIKSPRGPVNPMQDPGFFGGPLPVFFSQGSDLPYPLNPTTPPNAHDILEPSVQLATPMLGEPWKFDETVNPANVSHLGDGVVVPPTPAPMHDHPSSSNAAPPESPGNYTFRAGGRRERNDKYNPYFTPQRDPASRLRTGITPTRGFSFSLKSPPKMMTVAESANADATELDDDGVARSPPQLRTLYGTELDGDTRFGDYGRDLGRYDWGKFLPR